MVGKLVESITEANASCLVLQPSNNRFTGESDLVTVP